MTMLGKICAELKDYAGIYIMLFVCILALFAASLFLFMPDGNPQPELVKENYDEVLRVFMHEPGEYSVLVRQDGQIQVVDLRPFSGFGRTRLFDDVEPGQPMRASVGAERYTQGKPYDAKIEIHIHNVGEIEGGGWQDQTKEHRPHETLAIE